MDIDRIIALLKEADKLERTRALLRTRDNADSFTIGYGQEKLEFVLTADDVCYIAEKTDRRFTDIKVELNGLGVAI